MKNDTSCAHQFFKVYLEYLENFKYGESCSPRLALTSDHPPHPPFTVSITNGQYQQTIAQEQAFTPLPSTYTPVQLHVREMGRGRVVHGT